MTQVPAFVRFFHPLASRLLGFGIPMGPDMTDPRNLVQLR
jgi:hypothetical protein